MTTASGLSLDGARVQSVDRVAPAIGGVFDAPDFEGHEPVVHFCDPHVGLHAIVAIHSTVLGPALGGTRQRAYVTEAAALSEASAQIEQTCRGILAIAAVEGITATAAADRLAERRLRRAAAAA